MKEPGVQRVETWDEIILHTNKTRFTKTQRNYRVPHWFYKVTHQFNVVSEDSTAASLNTCQSVQWKQSCRTEAASLGHRDGLLCGSGAFQQGAGLRPA